MTVSCLGCILFYRSSWLSVQRSCELTERIQWQPMGQKRDIPVVESSNCRAAQGQSHWDWQNSSWLTDRLIQVNDWLTEWVYDGITDIWKRELREHWKLTFESGMYPVFQSYLLMRKKTSRLKPASLSSSQEVKTKSQFREIQRIRDQRISQDHESDQCRISALDNLRNF